jgi:hypothetical protein
MSRRTSEWQIPSFSNASERRYRFKCYATVTPVSIVINDFFLDIYERIYIGFHKLTPTLNTKN